VYNNCRSTAGPGGGVAGDFGGAASSATIITGGGLGVLEPETSKASVLGIIFTPPESNLSLAIDYYEIEINNEVTTLGAGAILSACYTSDNFPTDPICNQFDRPSGTSGITTVRDSYLNVAEQTNRGIDFTVRYAHDTPWGELILDSQTTWTLENRTSLFDSAPTDPLGRIGYPELVGNINASFQRGPWTAFWGFDWIGNQSSQLDYFQDNGSLNLTIDGRVTQVKAEAEFTGFHSVSLSYDFDTWKVSAGVANLFDELPPAASSNVTSVQGNSVFGSQYTEGFYGRRAFLRVSTSF
ncbi:MAG: TonB-dependent receptor, partial [Alphaproteobacteria bacterium]